MTVGMKLLHSDVTFAAARPWLMHLREFPLRLLAGKTLAMNADRRNRIGSASLD
jgi:hypothetical protein